MKRAAKKKEPCTRESQDEGYSFKGRIWIEGKEGTFLGHGRVVLLERIGQYGSISEAARSMGMSYRHAWDLVDSMNRQARTPLVETSTGGRGGGGTRLTAEGEKAIAFFQGMQERLKRFLDEEAARFGL